MRYIGSKVNLLSEIRSTVESQAPESKTFCDIFAGTGVVGREFKPTHQIISNDILFFSYVLNDAYNGLPKRPEFKTLQKKLGKDPIDYLNGISVLESDMLPSDFMALSYSPAGQSGRLYLTVENALKIDRIRQTIAQWLENGDITEAESHYFLASLIEDVPSVSNTTGTYGAFLKHWDKRALKPITLSHLEIVESSHANRIFNSDANELIHEISGDVLYLDTPYNGRQYSSNYHLLESLARYDQPELKGVTGTRVDKSGESAYCKKNSVFDSFDYLLANAEFKTIVISYSSDGLLNEEQLIELMTKHGNRETLNFRKIPYRRYKRTANDERNVLEYLIAINK
jgi:adenine-specific DNA-methyltransferase